MYSGIENISMAATETQSPRRNIPIAAKRIFWRVAIFYGKPTVAHVKKTHPCMSLGADVRRDSP